MLAVLEFADYVIISMLLICSTATVFGVLGKRSVELLRLARLERKVDAILGNLNIEFADPTSSQGLSIDVQLLADDPNKMIEAIRLHREETGLGLKEARNAVEAYRARPPSE